ncbi:hypothetical protein B0H65DRAFT_475839 [Neurospora tetraspora]|uniref:DUF202 domain-containing protein n=1 Tax=Neurospora tetraspora TaxID=94610 RepID=A0AAE0J9P1_9PEZI|nr:hypothetical protein B0H65DRAFT_475839 [Neurospora tetraspora]
MSQTATSQGATLVAEDEEENGTYTNSGITGCSCCVNPSSVLEPIDLSDRPDTSLLDENENTFCLCPLFGPLLFENESSDCRDHCANERTFLSFLRLSIYMAIVSVAIVLSFHLRKAASELELRMAKPLGIIFWALSVSCLGVGVANYIQTVNKYSRRAAIVQTGWRTQTIMGVIALSIVGACITLLVVNKYGEQADE